jgi:hypothetical protein
MLKLSKSRLQNISLLFTIAHLKEPIGKTNKVP